MYYPDKNIFTTVCQDEIIVISLYMQLRAEFELSVFILCISLALILVMYSKLNG